MGSEIMREKRGRDSYHVNGNCSGRDESRVIGDDKNNNDSIISGWKNLINERKSVKGQVSIFVIIAIVVVVGIVLFFVIRGGIDTGGIPVELKPVYDFYSECIEEETRIAVSLAGTQGGRIDVGDYIPGSEFAPGSSQLNFLGFGVPYWYYVAGNGIVDENVPTKEEMEREIEGYVEDNIANCDFEPFLEQGYEIDRGRESVRINILDESVDVEVSANLVVVKGEDRGRKTVHEVGVDSKIGKFFDIALGIYEKQQTEDFLEEYGIDVLRLYAPVDGVEISCSPEIWRTGEVVDEIKNGLEANIQSIKFEGDYYSLQDKDSEYFVVNYEVDEAVNVIYSKDWPTKIDVLDEDELMVAEPVGNQQGLGSLGFCYVPYHFVYDINFPVLIQVYNNEELFQFPIVAIIDNNVAKEAELLGFDKGDGFDLCEYENKDVNINVFDTNLNKINSNLSYKCFDQVCYLGESVGGVFEGKAPGCYNGFLIANSEGYGESENLFSTNVERDIDVILDREYNMEVSVRMNGQPVREALVSFTSEDSGGGTVFIPDLREIKLTEGLYEIEVLVYGASNVVIPTSTTRQCYEIPRGVLGGLFGITKEECVDIEVPGTVIDNVLVGGGKGQEYLLKSNLETGKLVVNVESMPVPKNLEEMQYNFEAFSELNAYLEFG